MLMKLKEMLRDYNNYNNHKFYIVEKLLTYNEQNNERFK